MVLLEFNYYLQCSRIADKMRWSLLALACVVAVVAADDKKEKDKDIGTVIGIDLGTTYSW